MEYQTVSTSSRSPAPPTTVVDPRPRPDDPSPSPPLTRASSLLTPCILRLSEQKGRSGRSGSAFRPELRTSRPRLRKFRKIPCDPWARDIFANRFDEVFAAHAHCAVLPAGSFDRSSEEASPTRRSPRGTKGNEKDSERHRAPRGTPCGEASAGPCRWHDVAADISSLSGSACSHQA